MTYHPQVEPTPAILFVRSRRDLDTALTQVNRFLAFLRSWHARDSGDIAAVCFTQDLDSVLPALQPPAGEAGIPDLCASMYESFSFAGIWTIVWMKALTFSNTGGRSAQRELILQAFTSQASQPNSLDSVHPVFARDESSEAVAMELARLKERHSFIADFIRFRQDDSREVYCESAVHG